MVVQLSQERARQRSQYESKPIEPKSKMYQNIGAAGVIGAIFGGLIAGPYGALAGAAIGSGAMYSQS